ncbi:MAG: antibiotic biosynthesis monooxygenase [bacterium]|nr:antibiotic biosynthesis monooxygenase [bacterium]
MIVVAGRIQLDPANREQAVAAAVEMMRETRKEAGCISYTFSTDLSDPGEFHIFEEWESQQALDAHLASPHMAVFQQTFGGFGITAMDVQKYQVSSVGPIH